MSEESNGIIRNNIIAISGTPVSGKSTTIKKIKEQLMAEGYKEENIHLVKTGQQFRDAYNSVVTFIRTFEESPTELMKAYQNDMFQLFLSKKEYRDAVFETMARLKANNVDLKKFTIEQANEAEEFLPIRSIIDSIIDQRVADMGKEINSEPRPDEVWIFDSRLAFYNIPEAFAVRLINDERVAAQRLFNDQERGAEDSNYANVTEAMNAVIGRKLAETKRYIDIYNVDLNDESHYDMIVDTSYATPDDIAKNIIRCSKAYHSIENGKRPYIPKRWCSPKQLLPGDNNEVHTYDRATFTLEEMQEIIKADGYRLDCPIDIVEVDGIKMIVEGHHRNFASALNGETLVPYSVRAREDEPTGILGQTAREYFGNTIRKGHLWGHEQFFDDNEGLKKATTEEERKKCMFSYNSIYPGIYNEIDRYNEEAIRSVHAKMQAQKALQRNKREFPSYPGE